jgi:hypothetical protein
MKYIEWLLSLFFGSKAIKVKDDAYKEINKANNDYINALDKRNRYLSKYSGKRRYTKA